MKERGNPDEEGEASEGEGNGEKQKKKKRLGPGTNGIEPSA